MSIQHDVKDLNLADAGRESIEWADRQMPVLRLIRVNLAAAEGHPGAVMDISFANQALCAEYMMTNAKSLEKKVYSVPLPIDEEIARLKLHSMGISVDLLTAKQEKHLASCEEGT